MNCVGRYEVIEKLGQGGMGTVYKAFDPLLTRVVAVKVISAQLDSYPEHRERFFREARAAAQLSHRNIITIYDLGEQDGAPFLAMEFLEGRDLEQRLREPECMSLARKLELAMSVCEGLAHAHAYGVVHRDVKPANVFVTGDGVVKILDFGLARLVSSEVTRSNIMVGTVNYMAPEQLRGEKADHRADIFSFGVLLYELLGGRKPFQADSAASTMYKILHETPEALEHIDPHLTPPLTTVVDRAIAKAREDRYQRMTDLLRDLEAAYEPLRGADRRVISHVAASLRPSPDSRPGSRPLTPVTDSTPTIALDPVPVRPPSGTVGGPTPAPDVPARPPGVRRAWMAAVALVALAGLVWAVAGRGRPQPSAPAPEPAATTAPVPSAPSTEAPPSVAAPAPVPAPAAAPPPPVGPDEDPRVERAARAERLHRQAREAFGAGQYRDAERLAGQALAADPSNRESRALLSRIAARERDHANAALAQMDAARGTAAAARARELVPQLFAAAEKEEAQAREDLQAGRLAAAAARMEATATLFAAARTAAQVESDARAQRARADEARRRAEQADAARPAPSPPPAPAPPRVDPAPAPVPAGPSPQEAIAAALRRYAAALEQRDIRALKAVWPGLGGAQQQAVEAEFANARSIAVDLASPKIDVAGSTATVTTVRHYQLRTLDGQQLRSDTATTFTLRQSGGEWLIDSVRHRSDR